MTKTVDHKVLDVRPMLAAGEEPLDLIIAAARDIEPSETLELIAPFEPMPLYAVLGRIGFTHRTHSRPDGSFVVQFTQTGIRPEATVAEIAERLPATLAVFERHGIDLCCGGGKTLEFVSRAHGIELKELIAALQAVAAS